MCRSPLLLSSDSFRPQTVRRMLKSDWWTQPVSASQAALSSGNVSFRGFFAKYSYQATVNGRTVTGDVEMKQSWGGTQTVTVRLPV